MTIYRFACRSCGCNFDTSVAASACPGCDGEDLEQEVPPSEAQGAGDARPCESNGSCGDCGGCDPSMIRPF
jgi:hypothetical protein